MMGEIDAKYIEGAMCAAEWVGYGDLFYGEGSLYIGNEVVSPAIREWIAIPEWKTGFVPNRSQSGIRGNLIRERMKVRLLAHAGLDGAAVWEAK